MSKTELLRKLADYARNVDGEAAHAAADTALLEFIDDPDITAAYDEVPKWYS